MKTNNNTLLGILVLLTIVIVTIATFSLGCTENPDNQNDITGDATNDTTSNSSDDEYTYGKAVIEETSILILESFPVQVHVEVSGYLPDGCTVLDEETVEFDEEKNMFIVDLPTKRPVDKMCTEALVPYETVIALDVYGLEKGIYVVDVNGILDQFELQTDNIIPE